MTRDYNPIDRREHDAAKAQAARTQQAHSEQMSADLQWFMGHPAGRRLMREWLARSCVYQTTFTGDSKGMFKEGARSIGLMLLSQITEHAFDDYIVMLREHQLGSGAHTTKAAP